MDMSATEMERSMRKKKKKNPDTGFAGMKRSPIFETLSP